MSALRNMLSDFVDKERAILEERKGGQTVGYVSSVTPSVLQRLEWMLRNTKDDAEAELVALREAQERLTKAARLLALETTDDRIQWIRDTDCHTNAAVVQHWRDEVLALTTPTRTEGQS